MGYVGQDPVAGFVTDTVEDELAYGMESLGVAPAVMRRRVEETLDLLGLFDLRDRPLLSLSAGEQQRVAIGSVLTVHPKVLVLDEPTSALDPPAADDVLAALTRLVHDLGMTVLVSEHRLERIVQHADRVVLLRRDRGHGRVARGRAPRQSGRPADRRPRPARRLVAAAAVGPRRPPRRHADAGRRSPAGLATPRPTHISAEPVAPVRGLVSSYDDVPALRGVDLDVASGEVVAVMGRNGAGKSTLLACLAGHRLPRAGDGTRRRPRRPGTAGAG